MTSIAFEKLRAQFWDSSLVLVPYYANCLQFSTVFSYEYSELTYRRAKEELDKANLFVNSIRARFYFGYERTCVDRLSDLINEAYAKLREVTELSRSSEEDFLF